MPINVRRFTASILLAFLFGFTTLMNAQAPATTPIATASPDASRAVALPKTQTSVEVMRDRISKVKAFIVVRNYNAAIYELENIRQETNDTSVIAVTNVLLMNSYLEQGDYDVAQKFLSDTFTARKLNKANSAEYYNAIAGQVVKSARNKIERYRALGLQISDRNLPLEAANDLEKLRETLELVVTQNKELSKNKNTSESAMAMLEEASIARSGLGRDDYDAKRWSDEAADSRESMASSRSVIINALDGKPEQNANIGQVATVTNPIEKPPVTPVMTQTAAQPTPQSKPVETKIIGNQNSADNAKKPTERNRVESNGDKPTKEPAPAKTATEKVADNSVLDVGSLVPFATAQASPIYPATARTMRTTGVVRVELTVAEDGSVVAVNRIMGPTLLQSAARDAIRKWRFRPFERDGHPVRATGFVNFNFTL